MLSDSIPDAIYSTETIAKTIPNTISVAIPDTIC